MARTLNMAALASTPAPDDVRFELNNVELLKAFFTNEQRAGIEALNHAQGTNEQVSFTAHLGALAGAVGNAYSSRMRAYRVTGNLYLAIVGPPSKGKSEPLLRAFSAAFDADERLGDRYDREYADWEAKGEKTGPPVRLSVIPSDFSQQSLQLMLSRGCAPTIYMDEIVRLFGRGRSGTAEDISLMYNSLWTGYNATVAYKNSRSLKIRNAIVSIAGGIQPALLTKLQDDLKLESGFFSRFLFCYPDDLKAPRLPDDDDDDDGETADYRYYVSGTLTRLYELQARPDAPKSPVYVPFDPKALKAAKAAYNALGDEVDALGDDDPRGAGLGKLRTYLLRFALLSAVNRAACERREPSSIDPADVERAQGLVTYFRAGLDKVMAHTSPERKPHPFAGKLMSAWYGEALNALPDGVELTNEAFRAHVEPFAPAKDATAKRRLIGNLKDGLTAKGLLKKTESGCWLKVCGE